MDNVDGVEVGEEKEMVENEAAAVIPTTQEEQSKELDAVFRYLRPEINIEKHADFIFAPAHSPNAHKSRSRSWVEILPDGSKVKASVLIESVRGRTLTTKTRKVYLALQQIREDKGWNNEEKTHFSLYEISKIAGLKWAGKKSSKDIRNELLQLRIVPFIWQYSFTDKDGHKVQALDTFNVLDHLKIYEKRDRKTDELFVSLSNFRFNEEIRKNLKANKTKPTNTIALKIRGEIASVLYARLDIVLADKTRYERTTAGLFEDLRLEGIKYRYPSARKQNLTKAIQELDGLPISTGTLSLSLEKTANGKDWKLVAVKKPLSGGKPRALIPQIVTDANPPEAIPYLAKDIGGTIGQQETNHPLYIKLCEVYSSDILYQALSEWKADGGREARNPRGYFMAILHRIAHQRGKLWFSKNCSETCKYRNPQARPPLERAA